LKFAFNSNVLATDEPDAAAQRLRENTVTMGKMKELQRRLNNGIQRRKVINYYYATEVH
jgi:hypothetical protein